MGLCGAQEGYNNNANIPLDNTGLLHDIFGTEFQQQTEDSLPSTGQGQTLGVQPGVARPDVPASQLSDELLDGTHPASVSVKNLSVAGLLAKGTNVWSIINVEMVISLLMERD